MWINYERPPKLERRFGVRQLQPQHPITIGDDTATASVRPDVRTHGEGDKDNDKDWDDD